MSTSIIIGIIGIIIAFILQIFLCYKGYHISYVAVIISLIIIATSQLPLVDTFTTAMSGVGEMLAIMMPIFLFGGILALVYVETGAAQSLAELLLVPFRKLSADKQRAAAIVVAILFGFIMNAAGINQLGIMVAQLAINIVIFEKYGIPRKYLACVQILSTTIAVGLPGLPTQFNVIAVQLLGVGISVAAVPRIVGSAVTFVLGAVFLVFRVKKDVKKGETFVMGNMDIPNALVENRPVGWLTIIPLVVIFVLYNWVISEAWISIAIGTVLAIVLFLKWFPKKNDETGKVMPKYQVVVDLCNRGAVLVPLMILMNALPAYILEQAPAYDVILEGLSSLPISAEWGYFLCTMILTGLGGAAGFVLNCQAALSHFAAIGLTLSAATAINLMTSTILDTLPTNLGVILISGMTHTKMKDAYKPIFVTTVLATFVGSIVTTLLCMIPGLAA